MQNHRQVKGNEWGDRIAIIISVLALLLSVAGFYVQSLRNTSNLNMQLIEFTVDTVEGASPRCRLDVVLFNSGNRDAALLSVILLQGKTERTSTGMSIQSTTFLPHGSSPGRVSHVVGAGEVKFLELLFPGCTPEAVQKAVKEGDQREISAQTEALAHDGRRSRATTNFSKVIAADQNNLAFSLWLEGNFDLMRDGGTYIGESKSGSHEMQLSKEGAGWIQKYSTTRKSM